MARSSLFERIAILEILSDASLIDDTDYTSFYGLAEELSRILLAMIKNLQRL